MVDERPAGRSVRYPAEWEHQQAVLLSWPHADTDWHDILPDVDLCYLAMATAIVASERLIIVTPEPERVSRIIKDLPAERVELLTVETNDTWIRDYGPITVFTQNDERLLLDFRFNAWGLKFAADKDNLVTSRIAEHLTPGRRENHLDMVLEGGALETDGRGTLLTTASCIYSINRNCAWDHERVVKELRDRLGVEHVAVLEHGFLEGDDTDGHIDTLARFTDSNTLVYCRADDNDFDCQAQSLRIMEQELRLLRDIDGKPYRMLSLPVPKSIYDPDDGHRLPATYANFLILNNQVLLPIYGQEERDRIAADILSLAFPNRRVTPIDCRTLIRQHGSLHCSTMQLY